jgi:hypothetical protein
MQAKPARLARESRPLAANVQQLAEVGSRSALCPVPGQLLVGEIGDEMRQHGRMHTVKEQMSARVGGHRAGIGVW